VVIFLSNRPPCKSKICVLLAELSDPKLDLADLCARSTSYTDFFTYILREVLSYWGEPQKIIISSSAGCQQPTGSQNGSP
jgi:hypothetical protein